MGFIQPQFGPALPEIALAIGICAVLLADLFISDRYRILTLWLTMIVLLVTAGLVLGVGNTTQLTFTGSFISDPLSQLLKLATLVVVAVVFIYSHAWLGVRGLLKGEYYLLGLFATLGIFVMVSAHNLIVMYLGLELMSLALYAMVAFDRDSPVAAESAMKYFVLGAIASAVLLYGMSLIYGVTGTLQFDEIAAELRVMQSIAPTALLGTAFILAAVAFKFGAIPFHNWVPDVYHGAPTSVTLFIASAPKFAAFAMLLRLLDTALGPVAAVWEPLLQSLALLSVIGGNVIAIAQTNIKRMLAYSAIAHVGFILLGFAAGTMAGQEAALFYTLVYVLMAACAFGVIIFMSRKGFEADAIDDFRGLNERSPWFAGMMLLVMASMIGIPPFAGFFAKLNVLAALVDAGQTWIAVVAVLFSVVGAFYYLRVIRCMYFDRPEADEASPPALEAGLGVRVLLSANALAVLLLGIFAQPLLLLCAAAIG